MLPIAVDAMGGDAAPDEIVEGAKRAAAELGLPVVLVGRPEDITDPGDLEVLPASEVIPMSADPGSSVRKMKDSSLVRAAEACRDGKASAMVSAGKTSGDLVHPLLFAPELLQQEFSSKIADMKNSVANRMNAQTSCAAQFLYAHIEDAPGAKKRRWIHIDLAGPSFLKGRGTGFGVALIAQAVRDL